MFKSLLNLFFPKFCFACSDFLKDNELDICTVCRHNLPVTNFHFTNDDFVKKVLFGRVKLELATALFRFEKKGIVQHLMHNLKYKGHEKIGEILGKWLGEELKTIEVYKQIDCVISVPLHKSKLRKRGYNQVTKFGQELANALNANYFDDVLIKINATKTQAHKSRLKRWNDNTQIFSLYNLEKIQNKHILLVDDIITTGATLEACCIELNKAENVTISVATMAIA